MPFYEDFICNIDTKHEGKNTTEQRFHEKTEKYLGKGRRFHEKTLKKIFIKFFVKLNFEILF